MIEQMKWIERKFNFDFPVGVFPSIYERLLGTPFRVRNLVEPLSDDILSIKPDNKWSIKERVGHIIVVENLWETRLNQFLNGEKELFAADMSNRKTEESDFNRVGIDDLLNQLETVRTHFLEQLEDLTEEDLARTALHPRLKTPMRLIDMCYFVAEHDDNEIALMRGVAIRLMN